MFVEVRRTGPEDLIDPGPELLEYAQRSDPLLTYWFGSECIAIVGFVPLGILSTTAYLWMQSTEHTPNHKLAVARLAKLTLDQIRDRYQCIVGECLVDSPSCAWLRWLGAGFGPPSGRGAIPFMIGSYQ